MGKLEVSGGRVRVIVNTPGPTMGNPNPQTKVQVETMDEGKHNLVLLTVDEALDVRDTLNVLLEQYDR